MPVLSLRKASGFILIFTYVIIAILVVMAGSIFFRTTHETRLVRRGTDAREAMALAEEGVAYAIAELRAKNWQNWYTHVWENMETSANLTANSDTNTKIGPASGNPDISNGPNANRCNFGQRYNGHPSQTGQDVLGTGYVAYEDSYFVPERCDTQHVFFVRTYPDYRSDMTDQTLQEGIEAHVVVIRSIGIVNGTRRAVEQRISRRSLYEFFYFFPGSKLFFSGNYDGNTDTEGNPVGSMHVNGNIYLRYASFNNLKELSCAGYIKQYSETYNSPEDLDKYLWDDTDKFAVSTGQIDGTGQYIRSAANYAYRARYIPDLDYKFQTSWRTNSPYVYVNGVKIPFRAEGVDDEKFPDDDDYDPYDDPDNPTANGTYFERGVNWPAWPYYLYNKQAYTQSVQLSVSTDEFRSLELEKGLDPNTITTQKQYWNILEYKELNNEAKPDVRWLSEWWDKLDEVVDGVDASYKYGANNVEGLPVIADNADKSDAHVDVRYLNTKYQSDEWIAWLGTVEEKVGPINSRRNLNKVIKDSNNGGKRLTPPEPEENFRVLAQANGIYIGLNSATQCEILALGQEVDSSHDLAAAFGGIVNEDNPFDPGEVVTFKHPLYPARNAAKEIEDTYVFTIDIGELTDNISSNFNGIVYIDLTHNPNAADARDQVQDALDHDYTVRLENAEQINEYNVSSVSGLTVYSPYQNVQLQGDFNTVGWEPAAVITNRR